MANSKTLIWQFKTSTLNPLPRSLLGYVQVPHALAESLVAEGSAQWPRIGAYRFNFIQPRPWETGGSGEFNPLDLFRPGDRGGFYNPNIISSLFQTRTGPTVPVTGNNDPVQYIVDQNGQFDLSRALSARGMVYFDGLLGMPSSGQLANLTSGNVPGFEQCTMVVCGAVSTPVPITANMSPALFLEVDNTSAFGGGYVHLTVRGAPRVLIGSWVPPDQNPTASMNIPDTSFGGAFTFGARFDANSATQYIFFNDIEATPTIAYSPVTAAASAAEFGGVGDDANSLVSIASFAFFIDRWLSDTELSQLKQWMLDNVAEPAFSPVDIFGPGDFGGVFDISRMDLCYQDIDGLTPVTALGQAVLSIRSVNNPNFLIKHNAAYSPTPLIYSEDSQGYRYLFDSNSDNSWTVYGIEDAGSPGEITEYSVISNSFGVYSALNSTLGGGSTVIGDTTGSQQPYTYGAVYAESTGDSTPFDVYSSLSIAQANLQTPYSGADLDGVPFVYTERLRDGEQITQINSEPPGQFSEDSEPFPAPVGMRFWTGAEGGWYGGLIISRWLSDSDTSKVKTWAASLSGSTL